MTSERFNQILESRVEQMREVLGAKAGEYAQNDDRLHNFKAAANAMDTTVPQALWGMLMKHFVSMQDMVRGKSDATKAKVDEKLGDMINYLVLLEAVFSEQRDELHETISPDALSDATAQEYDCACKTGAESEPTRWQDVAGESQSMIEDAVAAPPLDAFQWRVVERMVSKCAADPVAAYAAEIDVWHGDFDELQLNFPEVYKKVADMMIRAALSRVSKRADQ